jgi:hypothetical protein
MNGDKLALVAVAALAAASVARRGSRSWWEPQTDAQAQTLRVLMQRDREPFSRWLADYLDNDPEMLADVEGFDYFSDYLSDARDLSVREDGLLEAETSLHEVDRSLVGELPFALFHGTSTALVPNIRRQGLRPAHSQQQRSDKTYSTMAGVYVSTRHDLGVYAGMAARQHGGEPVILTLRRTLDELQPDPDDSHLGWGTSAMQWITSYVPVSDIIEWE